MFDEGLVQQLFATDDRFVEFAKSVVGVSSAEDFVAVVRDGDFSKMSPDAADVSVPGGGGGGRRLKLRKRNVSKANMLKPVVSGTKKVLKPVAAGAKKATVYSAKKIDAGLKRVYTGPKGTRNAVVTGVGAAAAPKAKSLYDTHLRQPQAAQYSVPSPTTYAKAMDADMEFSKVDKDKRQVFGWASITHMGGEPVVDRQGDLIDLEEVEKSAYDYVVKSRVGGRQHRRTETGEPFRAADLIESFVVTPEKAQSMGYPSDRNHGWWVGFKVNDDDTWDAVKRGDVTGFSVHGRGKRETISGVVDPQEVTQE